VAERDAILVLNAGSSSIKAAVFDGALAPLLRGAVTGIGGAAGQVSVPSGSQRVHLPDHATALRALLAGLGDDGLNLGALRGVGHRVVHGGADLTRPHLITHTVRDQIAACIPLAPLHNPHHLAAIDAVATLAPELPQCASFDTGFHATNPKVALRYALPDRAETHGLRRYGFHGISYAAMVGDWETHTGAPLPPRLLACHLGNGASLCAIRDGQSVASTMGYSPLDGLTMGTRTGAIDGNAVLHLARVMGIDDAEHLLNHESGLLGLSGLSADMRALEEDGSDAAQFAIDHFCYWAVRHAGSMIAAMGGLDAVAFTGGIGENAPNVRARIMDGLGWLGLRADEAANEAGRTQLHQDGSDISAWIVPAQEERRIATEALKVLGAA